MLPPCSGGGEIVVDAPKKQAQLRGRGTVSLSTEKPGPWTGAAGRVLNHTVPEAGTGTSRGRKFKSKQIGSSEALPHARTQRHKARLSGCPGATRATPGLPGGNPEKAEKGAD